MNVGPTIVSLLLADDHPLFRQGLAQVIAEMPSLKIVAEAGNGREVLKVMETTTVDIAILDINMPGMNGLQVAQQLLRRTPPVKIILLTMHTNERIFNEALDMGIEHYVLKDEATLGVKAAIEASLAGTPYISSLLSGVLLRRTQRETDFKENTSGLKSLTPIERSVLKLLAQSRTSKEIGTELGISHRTVGSHRTRISKKLGINGIHGLLQFALENKSQILSLPK